MKTHIRHIREGDEPPYLAGLVPCEHIVNGTSLGLMKAHPASCPHCHGTGWLLVPVVEDKTRRPVCALGCSATLGMDGEACRTCSAWQPQR